MRLSLFCFLVLVLLSCSRKSVPYRHHGRIYKGYFKVPQKGYPLVERVPYRDIEGIPHANLFQEIQLKYDCIAYIGEVVDTLYDIPMKSYKFQIQLSSKLPIPRGIAGFIHHYIDNTALIDIYISIDKEQKTLKEYLQRIIKLARNPYYFISQSEMEGDHNGGIFFGFDHPLYQDESDMISGVIWIGDKTIKITKGQDALRSIKKGTFRNPFHHQISEWGDEPVEVLMNYIFTSDRDRYYFDEMPVMSESPFSYLLGIRLKPKRDKSHLLPNISLDWPDYEIDTKEEKAQKILDKLNAN